MTFANALRRLRDIAGNYQPGEQPETCRVPRKDLRELLHHFDRLDAELVLDAQDAALVIEGEVLEDAR